MIEDKKDAIEQVNELVADMCCIYYEYSRTAIGNRLLDRMDKLDDYISLRK